MLRSAVCTLSIALLAISGCGGSPMATDAGSDAGPRDAGACHTAADCDDGLFCNGTESCTNGTCAPGEVPHCADGIACTLDVCSEDLHRCLSRAPDADHDGAGDASCMDAHGVPLGTDCDDHDMNSFPGNHEVCDPMHHDEDCNPMTHGGTDADGDTFESSACCNGTMCGTDCNDGARSVHPGATEVCNRIDDDCDAMTDEGVTITVYADHDHDGDGDPTMPTQACAADANVSVYSTDCHDDDPANNGRLSEVCDHHDNDCDGMMDENAGNVTWYRDGDGDGFGSPASGMVSACIPPMGYSLLGTDCDDTTNARSPARAEICNAIDDDCNGAADFQIAPGNYEDDDQDHWADSMCGMPAGMDCDDLDPNTGGASQPEICDGRDNDCDGHVDEEVMAMAFFGDHDGDGYGSEASGTMVGCEPTLGFTHLGGDCDDASALRHPGGVEGCNAIDDDCDGAIDEGEASLSCTLPNTQRACVVGTCAFVSCSDGYGDCSLAVAGCETNLATDPNHCGSCTNTCTMPALMCMSGMCM